MRERHGVRGIHLAGLALAGALLAGCSEVQSTVNQAEAAGDKAQTCTKALGLINLNPNVDPQKVADNAGRKAKELQQLAEQTANAEVKDSLFKLADSYVQLEQRKAEHLGNFNDWLQRNLNQLDKLRQACT